MDNIRDIPTYELKREMDELVTFVKRVEDFNDQKLHPDYKLRKLRIEEIMKEIDRRNQCGRVWEV